MYLGERKVRGLMSENGTAVCIEDGEGGIAALAIEQDLGRDAFSVGIGPENETVKLRSKSAEV